jgi:hypothetical protein
MTETKSFEGWTQIKKDLDGVQKAWIRTLEEELRLLPPSHNYYDAEKRRLIRRLRAELGMDKYYKDIEDEEKDPGLADKNPPMGRKILFPIGNGDHFRGGHGPHVIGEVRVKFIDKDGIEVFIVRGISRKDREWSTFDEKFEPLPYEMVYRVPWWKIIYVFPEEDAT